MADENQTYAAGDRVEVYDEEHGGWCAGTVETYGRTPMGLMYAVRSDTEFEGDLPLVWGVIAAHEAEAMRPLVKSGAGGEDDA